MSIAAVSDSRTLALSPGWNAVAFTGARLTALADNPAIAGVADYAGSYTIGPLRQHDVNGRRGYWVFAREATTLSYTAEDDGGPPRIELRDGWNLVGIPLPTDLPRSQLAVTGSVLPTFYQLALNGTQTSVDPTGTLKAGQPFWVFARGAATLTYAQPIPAGARLEVTPASVELNRYGSTQLKAELVLPDGTRQDVTSQVEWTSAEGSVVGVGPTGVITGLFPAATTITARYQSLSAQTGVTVTDRGTAGPLPSPAAAAARTGGVLAFDAAVGPNPPFTGQISSLNSFGNDFNVVQPIIITEVGAFDSGQNGLLAPVTVRLWNRATQTEVTSQVVPAGTAAPLRGTHRFVALAQPLELPAGFQGSIVWENNTDLFYRPDVTPGATNNNNLSRDAGGATLSFTGLGSRTGTFGAYPGLPNPPSVFGAAASFRYQRSTPGPLSPLTLPGVPEASQYRVVFDLNAPVDANYNGNFDLGSANVPYSYNGTASVPRGFDRVAYFFGLGGSYVWVSMDAFTTDPGKLGVPCWGSGGFFQQNVTNLNVFSSLGGLATGTGLGPGNLEFWAGNFAQANTRSALLGGPLPGASGTLFDFGDGGASMAAGYGSMQVHNFTSGQTVLAYNNWGNAGTNDDVGIGNQPAGNPDWVFASNAATYPSRTLTVLVRPNP